MQKRISDQKNSKAYETLTNEQKRASYDASGFADPGTEHRKSDFSVFRNVDLGMLFAIINQSLGFLPVTSNINHKNIEDTCAKTVGPSMSFEF